MYNFKTYFGVSIKSKRPNYNKIKTVYFLGIRQFYNKIECIFHGVFLSISIFRFLKNNLWLE